MDALAAAAVPDPSLKVPCQTSCQGENSIQSSGNNSTIANSMFPCAIELILFRF